MIDLCNHKLLSLAQAARKRPPGRKGRPTHSSTVYRWISKGVRGVKLDAIRIGGCLYTSEEALQLFADQLSVNPNTKAATTGVRAAEAANEELTRLGFDSPASRRQQGVC